MVAVNQKPFLNIAFLELLYLKKTYLETESYRKKVM